LPSSEPTGTVRSVADRATEQHAHGPTWGEISTKLSLWLTFGVIIGLLPLIITGFVHLMSSDFTWKAILASGEIFIALSVISASALGDLVTASFPEEKFRVRRIFASCACLLCFVCNAVAYLYTQVKQVDAGSVESTSISLFIATVITSGVCVGMAAGR
jgi:hypothetical protein